MNKSILLDGKHLSELVLNDLRNQIISVRQKNPDYPSPLLAIVNIGRNENNQRFIRNKKKVAESCGILIEHYDLDENIDQESVVSLIQKLNETSHIHGIVLQLPLPNHLNASLLLEIINPHKDVDGLHPINLGLLASNQKRAIVACTPRACLFLIHHVIQDIKGLNAVVIGRSALVGAPVAQLLLQAGASVSILHRQSLNSQEFCQKADIIVSAAGCPNLIKKNWVKQDSIIIDVGLTWSDQENRFKGDVCFDDMIGIVKAITPVPGGVGPMTIAMLLQNLYEIWSSSIN
jgi:methylenetetrahydrofolate dehydrogenase (NADP+)/methenyltetrahydrofolate cyclohydrolase